MSKLLDLYLPHAPPRLSLSLPLSLAAAHQSKWFFTKSAAAAHSVLPIHHTIDAAILHWGGVKLLNSASASSKWATGVQGDTLHAIRPTKGVCDSIWVAIQFKYRWFMPTVVPSTTESCIFPAKWHSFWHLRVDGKYNTLLWRSVK